MRNRSGHPFDSQAKIGRAIGAFVGLIFGCVGLTLIIFLWSQPFGQFGSPPLFFRVMGSFIALGFCVIGFGSAVAALKAKGIGEQFQEFGRAVEDAQAKAMDSRTDRPGNIEYHCPRCGAPLSDEAQVSPHGDVLCTYCSTWFNVHKQ